MQSIEELEKNIRTTILLFNGPIAGEKKDVFEMQGTFPRIGIASIAAYLKKNGFPVKIIDPFGENIETIIAEIKEFNPSIVGIPAFTSEIFAADYTAGVVKEINKNIITVVGGAHASALPEGTLGQFKNFDIAGFGEGEKTMLDIALGKDLNTIDGIAFRDGDKVRINPPREIIMDLDGLPSPAWELYDLDKYRGGNLMMEFSKKGKALDLPVEGARGCPFHCRFCFRINGKSIRFKSPENVINEVKNNIEKFGADTIFFSEGTFGVDKKIAHEMCDLYIANGLNKKATWSTGGRVNVLDEALLIKMHEAGCRFLGYGIESGDQELLDKMGKGTTLKQILDSFNTCKRLGIKTEANFILGHIGETENTLRKTVKFARKLKADYANFAIMVPFPGTEIFDKAVKNEDGFRIKTYDWRLYGKQIGAALEIDHLPNDRLIKWQNKAYFNFYLTPKRFKLLLKRLDAKRIKGIFKRLVHA
jgi:radical SAM superfamily enzyme YgiQ (UPF0313 family)